MIDATEAGDTIGVVLVGTYCWNNSPLDALMPRALLPIAHRPLMSYALSWLRDGQVEDIVVCGNRDTRALRAALTQGPPATTPRYQEDSIARGTAGALRDAALATGANTVVVAEGTAIPNLDLSQLLSVHRDSGAAATVVVHGGSRNQARAASQLASGIYVFDRRAIERVPGHGFCDIKENLIPELHRHGERVAPYTATAASVRVLSAATYLAANGWMVRRLGDRDQSDRSYIRSGDSLIHRDASLAADVTLVGPVLVGPHARIGTGATIVGPTSIGCDVSIGRGAVVSRSAVWRRSVLGEECVADCSIVADGAIVEPGTQTYRTVLAGASRPVQAAIPEPVTARHAGGLELWRRLGRALGYPAWSRSPAAQ